MSTPYNSIHTGAGIDAVVSLYFAFRSVSAATDLDADDHVLECTTGTFDVALPDTGDVEVGHEFVVKNTGTGFVTLIPASGQAIDGQLYYIVGDQYQCVILRSNGSDWIVTGGVEGIPSTT